MKAHVPKLWRLTPVFLLCCFVFLVGVAGCASRNEARVRRYYGLAKGEPTQDAKIKAALLLQFPIGTPSTNVESSLAARGLGKDGKSVMWLTPANKLRSATALCCGPYDYEQHSFSVFPMRRLTVWFDLDEKQNVKQINVESFNYGL